MKGHEFEFGDEKCSCGSGLYYIAFNNEGYHKTIKCCCPKFEGTKKLFTKNNSFKEGKYIPYFVKEFFEERSAGQFENITVSLW